MAFQILCNWITYFHSNLEHSNVISICMCFVHLHYFVSIISASQRLSLVESNPQIYDFCKRKIFKNQIHCRPGSSKLLAVSYSFNPMHIAAFEPITGSVNLYLYVCILLCDSVCVLQCKPFLDGQKLAPKFFNKLIFLWQKYMFNISHSLGLFILTCTLKTSSSQKFGSFVDII